MTSGARARLQQLHAHPIRRERSIARGTLRPRRLLRAVPVIPFRWRTEDLAGLVQSLVAPDGARLIRMLERAVSDEERLPVKPTAAALASFPVDGGS